jgi:Tol biopolymer transport system component
MMSLSPANAAAPRRLMFPEDLDGIAPFDWSADGQWLAVEVSRKDRTHQIGIVKVQDGSLRVLKSIDWKEPTKIFFSPDDRYLAYDLPVSETTTHRHVFVMTIDGTRETSAVAHASNNAIMGWSPDGRLLLFCQRSRRHDGAVGWRRSRW